MAAPQSSFSINYREIINYRDFINRSHTPINLRGSQAALYSITSVLDRGYYRQYTSADAFWCALEALAIGTKPICKSIGVKPLEAFDDFLRLRMGLAYAQWAAEKHAKENVTLEILQTELMAHNHFSVGVMAQLLSLAGSELGEVFQLGVCSQSNDRADDREIWDVYLCDDDGERAPTHTIWVINDNIEGIAGGKAFNHWAGIGPDPQDVTAKGPGGKFAEGDDDGDIDDNVEEREKGTSEADEEGVKHGSGIAADPPGATAEEPEGNSAEKDADKGEGGNGRVLRSSKSKKAKIVSAEPAGEQAETSKKRKSSTTDETQNTKKAKVDKANNIRDQPYNYRRNNDAPPSNTDLPHENMAGITPEELWVYFPNHCQEWPQPALQLINAGSETTGRWSWLADAINKSRLLESDVHHRKKYAIPNTINKKITSAVTEALGLQKWDKSKHEDHRRPQTEVDNMPRLPRHGSGQLERAWPLWQIGANLVVHDWPGHFRDRVIADMLAHPREVAREQARLATARGYDVALLQPLQPLANPPAAVPLPAAPSSTGLSTTQTPADSNSLSGPHQPYVSPYGPYPPVSQVNQQPSQPNFVAPTATMINPNANGAQIPGPAPQQPANSMDNSLIDPRLLYDPSNQPQNPPNQQ